MNKNILCCLYVWNGLIDTINNYAPAKYEIGIVDDPKDLCVVNDILDGLCVIRVIVDDSIDLDMALDRCWKLGKIVETILNQYDTSDDTKEWFMHNEPSFLNRNRKECDDEWVIKNGGIVQYSILKDRR